MMENCILCVVTQAQQGTEDRPDEPQDFPKMALEIKILRGGSQILRVLQF
jgi:hypothetical protein